MTLVKLLKCVCVRVTQVQVEVLVFQAWMDVMELEEREEILDNLENKEHMENWSENHSTIPSLRLLYLK